MITVRNKRSNYRKYNTIEISKITTVLNGDVLMLLTTALEILRIFQLLPFIVSRDTSSIRNKVDDQEFNCITDDDFIPDWGSETPNLPSLLVNSSKNSCYFPKMRIL